jgi:hypothetical protein
VTINVESNGNLYLFTATGWTVTDDGTLYINDDSHQLAAQFAHGHWASVVRSDTLADEPGTDAALAAAMIDRLQPGTYLLSWTGNDAETSIVEHGDGCCCKNCPWNGNHGRGEG